jgi:hypothetical protein
VQSRGEAAHAVSSVGFLFLHVCMYVTYVM